NSRQFCHDDAPSAVSGTVPAANATNVAKTSAAATNSSVQQAKAIAAVIPSDNERPNPQSSAPPEQLPSPPQPFPQPLVLSLFDAVELGLAQNPDLVALRYAQDGGEEAVGVAHTYPFNPWVQIQVTPSQTSPVAN